MFVAYYGFYLIKVNIEMNYRKHRDGEENHTIKGRKDFEDAVVSHGGYAAAHVVSGILLEIALESHCAATRTSMERFSYVWLQAVGCTSY